MTSSPGPAKQWASKDKTSSEPLPQIILSLSKLYFFANSSRKFFALPSGYLEGFSVKCLNTFKTVSDVPSGVSLDESLMILFVVSESDLPGT